MALRPYYSKGKSTGMFDLYLTLKLLKKKTIIFIFLQSNGYNQHEYKLKSYQLRSFEFEINRLVDVTDSCNIYQYIQLQKYMWIKKFLTIGNERQHYLPIKNTPSFVMFLWLLILLYSLIMSLYCPTY